jgi:hypothetical protein
VLGPRLLGMPWLHIAAAHQPSAATPHACMHACLPACLPAPLACPACLHHLPAMPCCSWRVASQAQLADLTLPLLPCPRSLPTVCLPLPAAAGGALP